VAQDPLDPMVHLDPLVPKELLDNQELALGLTNLVPMASQAHRVPLARTVNLDPKDNLGNQVQVVAKVLKGRKVLLVQVEDLVQKEHQENRTVRAHLVQLENLVIPEVLVLEHKPVHPEKLVNLALLVWMVNIVLVQQEAVC